MTENHPNPPSLKEQALEELDWVDKNLRGADLFRRCDAVRTIRRALESSPLVEEPTSMPMAESWPSKIHFSGGDLPDGEYVIDADFLNYQYNIAIKNFDLSEVHEEGSPLYIYFRAMWIGYAAAAAGTRNYARNNPASPGATQ